MYPKKRKKATKTTLALSKDTFCTDSGQAYNKIKSPTIAKSYKNQQAGRFTKEAIAQFIDEAEFIPDKDLAFTTIFKQPITTLKKKERKVLDFAYQIAEGLYLTRLHKMVLIDEKAHSTLRVIAEIKGMIKKDQGPPPPTPAGLHVTLTSESTEEEKAAKKKYEHMIKEDEAEKTYQPLQLDENVPVEPYEIN